jgi:hypothetical protein
MSKRLVYSFIILLCIGIIAGVVVDLLSHNGFLQSSEVKNYLYITFILLFGFEMGVVSVNSLSKSMTVTKLFDNFIVLRIALMILFIIGMIIYAWKVNVETEHFIITATGMFFVCCLFNFLYTASYAKSLKRENLLQDE